MSTLKIRDPRVWDCGSTLYDSFELKSFKDQLDLAISKSRCNSMPRQSEPAYTYPIVKAKKSYVRLFISSIFRFKKLDISCKKSSVVEYENFNGGFLISDSLPTIPEGSEKGFESLDLDRKVRKTMSERYMSSSSSRIQKHK